MEKSVAQMYLHHAVRQDAAPLRVYWADVMSEPGISSFDEPAPGAIDSLPLILYIPSQLAVEFRSDKTSPFRAEEILRRLGPTMRAQADREWSLFAALLSRHVQWRDVRAGVPLAPFVSRKQIEEFLFGPLPREASKRQLMLFLREALPTIWRVQEEERDKPASVHEEDVPSLLRFTHPQQNAPLSL